MNQLPMHGGQRHDSHREKERSELPHLAVLDEAVVPFAPEVGEVAKASEEEVAGNQQADVHVDGQHLHNANTNNLLF